LSIIQSFQFQTGLARPFCPDPTLLIPAGDGRAVYSSTLLSCEHSSTPQCMESGFLGSSGTEPGLRLGSHPHPLQGVCLLVKQGQNSYLIDINRYPSLCKRHNPMPLVHAQRFSLSVRDWFFQHSWIARQWLYILPFGSLVSGWGS